MDKSRYPADWDTISQRVRAAAGNRCAWCGVPNGALGYRDPYTGYFTDAAYLKPCRPAWTVGSVVLIGYGGDGPLGPGRVAYRAKLIRVVLTVAHLGAYRGPVVQGQPIPWGSPHDKADVRPENLASLCQRCHLGYDRDDHARHAAATRYRQRIESGQPPLL